jgi:hypothetical protein
MMTRYYSSPPSERSGLLRKIVLIFLLVTALALGLVILFREKPGYPYWLQNGLAASSLAVAAAFTARLALKRRSGFLRLVASLAALMVGLYVLGMASHWKYGIGPLNFWPRAFDWDAIAQAGLGIYLVFLALTAWSRRSLQVRELAHRQVEPVLRDLSPAIELPAPRKSRRSPRKLPLAEPDYEPAISMRHVVHPRSAVAPVEPAVRLQHTRRRPRGVVRPLTAADLPVRPKARRGRGRKPRVQFAVVEEHRCPYCLETVSRADPRGAVECDICHALHHKDCWDITGICQVPHLNS